MMIIYQSLSHFTLNFYLTKLSNPYLANKLYIFLPILILLITLFFIIIKIRKSRIAKDLNKRRLPSRISTSSKIHLLNSNLKETGFAYEARQDIFYSLMDGWQRNFGYCRLYDEAAAPLSMIIDCEPIRFEYNERKWLIELWKGQYGMTTGAEIGVYVSDAPDLDIPGVFNGTFYESVNDDELLPIAYSLKKNGKTLLTRKGIHWWLTGFKLGEFSHPSELSMDIMITLKSAAMCQAFVDALKSTGYQSLDYLVINNTVYFTYGRPYSSKPFTRTILTEYMMQKNNNKLCKYYNDLTKNYTHTLDKVEYIRLNFPDLYGKILRFSSPKELYQDYNKIKNRENYVN